MKRIVEGEFVECGSAPELPWGGDGVFETILIRNGQPVFWTEHFARFAMGCTAFALRTPRSGEELAESVCALARENNIDFGVGRICAWRPTYSPARAEGLVGDGHWSVDVTPPRPHMRLTQLRATRADAYLDVPDAHRNLKHLKRDRWLEPLRKARVAGWDEALLCNHRSELVEGCVSNVFFIDAGVLCTPGLSHGGLPGIVRGEVIRVGRDLGWEVREGVFSFGVLANASDVWLTNSLIGVRPVTKIDRTQYRSDGSRLRELCSAWIRIHGWNPGQPLI